MARHIGSGTTQVADEAADRIGMDALRSRSPLWWMRTLAVVATALALLAAPSRSSAQQLPVVRTAGENRVATAVAISAASWPSGADTALLARADAYPDALSASPLAAALDAPLLLTAPTRLDPLVVEELDRLGVSQLLLLGGEAALEPAVARTARDLGLRVRRVAGSDRFATSAAIADELRIAGVAHTDAYVARATQGKGWPDALSVAPMAGRQQRPLLLADRQRLPYPSKWLGAYHRLTLVGGTAVLDDRVAGGRKAARIAGADRYATSVAVADAALAELRATGSPDDGVQVWLTTGRSFPDALAAGPAVAARDAVLLLVPSAWYGSPIRAWIVEHLDEIAEIRMLGGPAALPDAVENDLAAMDPEDPSTLEPPPDTYALMYSLQSDLRDARPLDGATVSGSIHVFLARCDADGRCVPTN